MSRHRAVITWFIVLLASTLAFPTAKDETIVIVPKGPEPSL